QRLSLQGAVRYLDSERYAESGREHRRKRTVRLLLVPVCRIAVVRYLNILIPVFDEGADRFLKRYTIENVEAVCCNPPERVILQDQTMVGGAVFPLVEIPAAVE